MNHSRAHEWEEELTRIWNSGAEHRDKWALVSMARSLHSIDATLTSTLPTLLVAIADLADPLVDIAQSLSAIRGILEPKFPVKGIITQSNQDQGATMPVTGTILGLAPGASDTFFVTPVDVNGNADALPTGSPIPTFAADDATVTLTPAADGLSVVALAATTATAGGSFNLSWAASYTDASGATVNISATANVPYLAPPALLPVGGVISQGSPAVSTATARRK